MKAAQNLRIFHNIELDMKINKSFSEDCVALLMEAARTSETLVNFYQTTRCYNPEDINLHTHRRENLKSYQVFLWELEENIAYPVQVYYYYY
jgi:hypothetical protein